jgi:hypothetical protein
MVYRGSPSGWAFLRKWISPHVYKRLLMAGSIERQEMKNAALLLLAAFFRNSF